MIGNDIVDLHFARQENNWRRKGFLDKVFTAHEQQRIQSASDPDVMVWALWSMKESVYKLIVRETGNRFFAPKKIACHLNESHSETLTGAVFYQTTYQTQLLITARYVATVAFSSSEVPSFTQIIVPFDRTDYQHQHTVIRKRLNYYCAVRFSSSESRFQLQKNEAGVPTLSVVDYSGNVVNKPISLSHHGHYGAFVLP